MLVPDILGLAVIAISIATLVVGAPAVNQAEQALQHPRDHDGDGDGIDHEGFD